MACHDVTVLMDIGMYVYSCVPNFSVSVSDRRLIDITHKNKRSLESSIIEELHSMVLRPKCLGTVGLERYGMFIL